MNYLFLHNNYPAQFRQVAAALAARPGNNVVFLSEFVRQDQILPGVRHGLVMPPKPAESNNQAEHAYLTILRRAEAYGNAMLKLKKQGFTPDLIYDHCGWGCGMYAPDIFPQVVRASYFEWFYTYHSDYNFLGPGQSYSPVDFAPNRQRNLCQLDALYECDLAVSPSNWQRSQYPKEYQSKIQVIHEGVDTNFFSPSPGEKLIFENVKDGSRLDLSEVPEIVSYATRGLEPYRGFPQFFRSLPRVLAERPNSHVVIMAEDRVSYGPRRKDGKSWREAMLQEVDVDLKRVHFVGFKPYAEYLRLLRASSVHVYLTVPFVLSWSLLEAMSCGCLIVAADTEPVREVMRHNENGLLTAFKDHEALAGRIIEALKNQGSLQHLRNNARQCIVDNYSLEQLLPRHLKLLDTVL